MSANGNGKPASNGAMVEKVRPWVIMAIGVVLVLYSLSPQTNTPAALMLGCSMIGGVPLDLAFNGSKNPKT